MTKVFCVIENKLIRDTQNKVLYGQTSDAKRLGVAGARRINVFI